MEGWGVGKVVCYSRECGTTGPARLCLRRQATRSGLRRQRRM